MKKLLLLICIFALSVSLMSQTVQRKKVAVVLSGGGAKGMAHIGALKVIERAGIPIDIITGTSMGSIIGGLYSIGYDAHALDSMVRVQNWASVLSDKEDASRKSIADRRKQNTYLITKSIVLGGQNSLAETGGIMQGKNLSALFDKLTIGYHDSIDFNTLPIPFACVATDIVDNTEYDFRSGVLAKAMRASMSIPGVFSPIRMGDMVLVDGGLRNNFPVDIARRMGADVIIGISVQSAPKTADELKSGMSVLGQIVDVNCKNKYDDNFAMADVPIWVNPSGYSSASFNKEAIDTLIRRGEAETMRHWDQLMELKKQIGIDDSFVPRHLHYSNVQAPDSVEKEPVRELSDKDVFTANLAARFDLEEMAALQINGAYTPKNSSMDYEATLRLGKRIMARLDAIYNPLNRTKTRLSYIFRRNDLNQNYKGSREYNITYNYHAVDLSLLDFNVRNFNVNVGVRWDYYHYQDVLVGKTAGQKVEPFSDEHYFSYYGSLSYNSENRWHFASRGAKFQAGFGYYTDNMVKYKNNPGFSTWNAMWRFSFPINDRLTFKPMAYGRVVSGKNIPPSQQNYIGGEWFGYYLDQQMPFVGMGYFEYVDNAFAALQLGAQQRMGENHYVLFRFVGALKATHVRDLVDNGMMTGYQLSYYYDSMFGPVGASLGYTTRTSSVSFYINLGFEF